MSLNLLKILCPKTYLKQFTLFLNRNGGTIVLGVDDTGKIEGVNPEKVQQLAKNIVNLSNNPQKLFPTFLLDASVVDFNSKKLIYIYVPISSQVHKCNSKIYDRSHDGDFELKSDEQIKQLYNRKSILYSENRILPYLNESYFSTGIVNRTRKIIKINRPDHPWNELSDTEFFVSSGRYRNDLMTGNEGFTMAALLLFGRDEIIQSAIPHYKIDAIVLKVNEDRYDD